MSKAPLAVTALLEYETAVHGSEIEMQREQVPASAEELLSPESRPQLLPGVSVINLPADYQEIVRRLRQRSSLSDLPDRAVKLAIRRTQPGSAEVRQLSPLSAELLDLCEEGLTVKEMAAEFLLRNLEVPGVPPERVCLAGIEILRQQRLIGLA
jgi:hypothetical protein